MSMGLQILLMTMSCLSLIGLGLSGMMVSRAHKQRTKRDARLSAITSPHHRVQRIELTAFTRAVPQKERSVVTMVAALFKLDLERLDQYPLRWWIILLLTLATAKALESVAGNFLGELALPALPVVWVILSRMVFGWAANRRKKLLLNQFPDALAMIVRSVRVGIPVMEAIRAVSRESQEPTGPEFAHLVSQVSIGVTLEDAVQEMARRGGIPEYRFFATALSLQNQTGGTLSDTLENLADVIRKRVGLIARGKALTSEARASVMILAALPVVTGVMLWVVNPTYIDMLFTDKTGNSLFGAAVLSLLMGLGVIKVIIKKSLP
ncbi:MAG TPA: type II secretion system F family protein [Acetobacteraceae bacterium]|jgi:tight adherence protein B